MWSCFQLFNIESKRIKVIQLYIVGGGEMSELKEIMDEIEKVRKKMHDILQEKEDMLDKEVIAASQMLDSVLNEYYKILNKNVRRK